MADSCGTCRFAVAGEVAGTVECHYHAPMPYTRLVTSSHTAATHVEAVWPIVSASDYCAQFSVR